MANAFGIAQAFGHPEATAVIFAKGDRVANIGLGGEDVHRETGGQGGLGRSVGCREPCKEHLIGGRRGILGGVLQSELAGQHRALGVKAEVIEVQMTPVTRAVVHQTDEDLLTDQTLQFDDHGAEGLTLGAGDFEEGLPCRRIHQFYTGLGPRTTGDQEAGPRVSHLEGHGGERSLRVIARALEAADPKLALVVRLHVGAALGDHISTDQGLIERLAVSLPIAQIARLKSQVQRPPIRRPGDDRVGQRRRQRTAHENSRQQRCQTRRTEELHAPSLGGAFYKASPIASSLSFYAVSSCRSRVPARSTSTCRTTGSRAACIERR